MKNLILRLAKENGVEEILEFSEDSQSICRYSKNENKIIFNIDLCRSSFDNLKEYYFIDFKHTNVFAEVVFQLTLSSHKFRNLGDDTKEEYYQQHAEIKKNFSQKLFPVSKEVTERFLQVVEDDCFERFERKQWAKHYKFMRKKDIKSMERMKNRAKEIFEHAKMEDYELIFDFGNYNGQCRYEKKEIAINLSSCFCSFTSSKFYDPCDYIELIVSHELGHALDRKKGTYVETDFDMLFQYIKNGFYHQVFKLYDGYMANCYKNEINAWNFANLFIKHKLNEEAILFEMEDSLKRSQHAFEKKKVIFMKTYIPKVFRSSC